MWLRLDNGCMEWSDFCHDHTISDGILCNIFAVQKAGKCPRCMESTSRCQTQPPQTPRCTPSAESPPAHTQILTGTRRRTPALAHPGSCQLRTGCKQRCPAQRHCPPCIPSATRSQSGSCGHLGRRHSRRRSSGRSRCRMSRSRITAPPTRSPRSERPTRMQGKQSSLPKAGKCPPHSCHTKPALSLG